jgi:hypothetical protein
MVHWTLNKKFKFKFKFKHEILIASLGCWIAISDARQERCNCWRWLLAMGPRRVMCGVSGVPEAAVAGHQTGTH